MKHTLPNSCTTGQDLLPFRVLGNNWSIHLLSCNAYIYQCLCKLCIRLYFSYVLWFLLKNHLWSNPLKVSVRLDQYNLLGYSQYKQKDSLPHSTQSDQASNIVLSWDHSICGSCNGVRSLRRNTVLDTWYYFEMIKWLKIIIWNCLLCHYIS